MANKTVLFSEHVLAGARMVDFAGWEMPLHYGSQLEEHKRVRADAGIFDVSHMVISELKGAKASAFLQYLLANDVAKLKETGKAIYTCMLNEQGGVIDDLIVYRFADDYYRLVTNAATRSKDLAWIEKHAQDYDVMLTVLDDVAMLAVQGPQAMDKLAAVFQEKTNQIKQLKPFSSMLVDDCLVARTGYTGEDGVEIMLNAAQAPHVWKTLLAAGVAACGLGARDSLRLEAGLNLYGVDMDESTSPLESNLAWTVAFAPDTRDFCGRAALLRQQAAGVSRKLVGLVLEQPGVLRHEQRVIFQDHDAGVITSGGFSPSLNSGIAFARIPAGVQTSQCSVEIRNKTLPARIVKPPFVRQGKVLV